MDRLGCLVVPLPERHQRPSLLDRHGGEEKAIIAATAAASMCGVRRRSWRGTARAAQARRPCACGGWRYGDRTCGVAVRHQQHQRRRHHQAEKLCFSVHKPSEGGGGKRRTNGERNEELAESGPCFARIQRRAPATHSHARSLNRPRGRARAPKVRLQCMHDDCSRRSALYAFFPAPLSRLLETSLPEAP